MKLFLFIILNFIFINGAKSESKTTISLVSIYNNDFKLFEKILEREKRESNSLSESNNKDENDNNSEDPINDNNSKKEIQPKTKEDAIQNNNKNDDINNSKSPVNQDKNNNGKSELTNSKNKKSTKNNLKRLLKRLKKLKKKNLNRKNTNNNKRPQIQDINERPPIKNINERPHIQDINQRPTIEAFKINGQTFLRCKRQTDGSSSCNRSPEKIINEQTDQNDQKDEDNNDTNESLKPEKIKKSAVKTKKVIKKKFFGDKNQAKKGNDSKNKRPTLSLGDFSVQERKEAENKLKLLPNYDRMTSILNIFLF
jgi:hypothetical protein